MAGPLLTEAAKASGAPLLPVDSEHSAIFQSLRSGNAGEVKRIILTASGGPFLDATVEEIEATVGYLAEMADNYERQLFGTDDY